MEQASQASPRPRASLLRRLVRLKVRWLGIAAVLATGILLDGRVPRRAAGWTLGGIVGADVTITRLRFEGLDLVADDVVFTAPNWKGPGAEVARVRTVRLDIDWPSTLMGDPRLERLEFHGGEILLIESATDPSAFNMAGLRTVEPRRTRRTSTAESPLPFDALTTDDLTYATGVATADGVELRRQVPGTLTIRRTDPQASTWTLALDLPTLGVDVRGTYDARGAMLDAELEPMAWSAGFPDLLPSRARAALEQVDPSGRISRASFRVSPRHPASLNIRLDGFSVKIPEDAVPGGWVVRCGGGAYVAASPPTLEVARAEAVVTATRLELLGAEGTLETAALASRGAPLPFHASGWLDLGGATPGAPAADATGTSGGMEGLVGRAAFEAVLSMEGFALNERGDASCIVLPTGAAQALQQVGVRSVELDVGAVFRRAASAAGDGPAPMTAEVVLALVDGSIEVPAFPYPLDSVNGRITVEGSAARLEGFSGTGRSGAHVFVDGTLQGLGGIPSIELRVRSPEITVDGDLRRAVAAQAGSLLDDIFDLESAAALSQASLGEIVRDFSPGGRASFDLRVQRAAAPGALAMLVGDIRILEGRVLLKPFPLPLLADGGLLRFEPGRVDLAEPITFRSLAGGRGSVGGSVDIIDNPDGPGVRAVPRLTFEAHGEPTNPLLWHAIPPGPSEPREGWPTRPSLAGRALASLDPAGRLDVTGEVTRFGARPAFDIVVSVAAERVGPPVSDDAHDVIGWPGALTVRDGTARLRVTPGRVAVERSEGIVCGGAATAAGVLIGEGQRLVVNLDAASIGCLGEETRLGSTDALPGWWRDAAPDGVTDGELTITDGVARLELRPDRVDATVGGQRLSAHISSGWVELSREGAFAAINASIRPVEIEAAEAAGDGSGAGAGAMHASAQLEWPSQGTGESRWSATIPNIAPGSVVAGAILAGAGADTLGELGRAFGLATTGSLRVDGAGASVRRIEASLDTATIAAGSPHELTLAFDPPATILATDGILRTAGLRAPLPGGSFDLQLAADLGNATERQPWFHATIAADSDGGHRVLGLIPEPARTALVGLGLDPGLHTALLGGEVTAVAGDVTAVLPVSLREGRIDVGIPVREYDGDVAVHLDGGAWRVLCRPEHACLSGVPVEFPSADVAGAPGLPIEASLILPIGPGTLLASVGVPPDAPWQVDLSATGVPLAGLGMAAEVHAATPLLGRVDGQLRVSGTDPMEAAGTLRVSDGDFGPAAPDILSPLNLGGNRRLRNLDASVHLTGRLLTLDDIVLSGDGPRLLGSARVDLDTGQVSGRLRGRSDVPIVSAVLAAMVDPIVQLEVSGHFADVKTGLLPLPGLLSPAPPADTKPPEPLPPGREPGVP